ncbi:transporter substrate-binding domain-containing protein [Roseivirga sp.]|uniref:transporter substrate-binding domain-containing protein n=1 Tax=Roseivirga sp. TaxID=1964215 RepID=UPI002B276160|nr:transporter substrate-binding domain-containing protein [Roseivirga sp.]
MIKRKSLVIFMVLFSVLLILTSCRKSATTNSGEATMPELRAEPVNLGFDEIKERGTLTAVVDNSSTGYFIYRGQPMGYEYDLLSRMASDLGLNLKIKLTSDIDEAFFMLNTGAADVMAYHLTVTKERTERVAFTDNHTEVRQVLVQRKPKGWRKMKLHDIEESMIRNPLDLGGKEVHTRKGSSFSERLENLSNEIGEDIIILEDVAIMDTESLIKKVAEGQIEYTIADEDIAMINATYYPDLDVETAISFPQKIAWAVRKNAPVLKDTINHWLDEVKSTPDFNMIYDRYFKYRKTQNLRAQSDFSSVGGTMISPYDELFKSAAENLSVDWVMLASLAYQESKFDPEVESWAGAKGLLQLTDISIEQFNVQDPFNPEESIEAGTEFLEWLEDYWADKVTDPKERLKFVLGSYNVGQGHVMDAVKLTKKYGKDPQVWDGNVAEYLIAKSTEKFYTDPVVRFGYCRGDEPVNYVMRILERYDQYKTLFAKNLEEQSDSTLVTVN